MLQSGSSVATRTVTVPLKPVKTFTDFSSRHTLNLNHYFWFHLCRHQNSVFITDAHIFHPKIDPVLHPKLLMIELEWCLAGGVSAWMVVK